MDSPPNIIHAVVHVTTDEVVKTLCITNGCIFAIPFRTKECPYITEFFSCTFFYYFIWYQVEQPMLFNGGCTFVFAFNMGHDWNKCRAKKVTQLYMFAFCTL